MGQVLEEVPLLQLIDVSITNNCNLSCKYCSANSGGINGPELSVNILSKLFDDLDRMNVPRVSITGGEPFMHKNIIEIIQIFGSHRFAKVLNTNGTLLTEEISREIKSIDLDRVCVTIDGSRSNVHDSKRGAGTFKKAIEGIRCLQKYNLPVSILFTLGTHNYKDLINTIQLAELLEIEYFSIMMICPTGRADRNDIVFYKDEWSDIFTKISQDVKDDKYKVKVRFVPPNEGDVFWQFYFPLKKSNRLDLLSVWNQDITKVKNERAISCQAGRKACSVNHIGEVYGCDLMNGNKNLVAGNIYESPINEIWSNSPHFNEIRKYNYSNITGKCATCIHEWCGGGCRLTALELDGSLLGSDVVCSYGGENAS